MSSNLSFPSLRQDFFGMKNGTALETISFEFQTKRPTFQSEEIDKVRSSLSQTEGIVTKGGESLYELNHKLFPRLQGASGMSLS